MSKCRFTVGEPARWKVCRKRTGKVIEICETDRADTALSSRQTPDKPINAIETCSNSVPIMERRDLMKSGVAMCMASLCYKGPTMA